MNPDYSVVPLGDSAITVDFGNVMDEVINQRVIQLFHYWKEMKLQGVKDLIPAYSSLTIVYDVSVVQKEFGAADFYSFMKDQLENSIINIEWKKVIPSPRKEIPVCYDTSVAPDLKSLGELKKLPVDEIIHLHCSKIYRVYMIGFLPGFAYMGKVDERIAAPRKETPSPWIQNGSVGIAGEQTGIYPLDSPGGWHIIGQTPVKLFDAEKKNPVLLNAGDDVQFVPITLKEFQQLKT